MKKYFFLIFCLIPVAFLTSGQNVLENNPPAIKWYQVNTPRFNILFQEGFKDQAQRVAGMFEQIYAAENKTLGSSPSKISVILQNQSSVSNGFVSYLPRRSELFMMPSQDYNFTGTNDWITILATHEYRHIAQFQHATQGVNRLFFYLFGYQALTGLAHVAVPGWFWEGDAVAAETAFTHSGRGRIPNFGLLLRTNLLEGRKFNYHKQLLGSYKHRISDEYVLGYYMVSYLRKRTGDPMIWGKITERAWRSSVIPFTFSTAIKKETDMYVASLYNEMADDLKNEWQQKTDSLVLTSFEKVNFRKTKAYTDYLYPQLLDDGSIIAVKTGIADIRQLVTLKDGKERKVFVQGIVNDAGMLSAAAGKVVWNEFRFHPRWRMKTYSVINSFDVVRKRKRQVTRDASRVAAAAISPDGSKVVAVQTDKNYRHTLLVIDMASGNVLKEFTDPENKFYSMPRWSDDGNLIVTLLTGKNGKSVVVIDPASSTVQELIPAGDENIGSPVLHGNFLYYNSPVTGIDNIFALDIENGKRYQITVSRYGAYNPCISPDGKIMYYNEQDRNGMDIVKAVLDQSSWKVFEADKVPVTDELSKTLAIQEAQPDLLKNNPQTEYPVRKYYRMKGLINPYAWGLYVDQSDLTRATASISSRDILSTTEIAAGYEYDILEETGSLYGNLSYQGWFPVIEARINHGNREVETGINSKDVKFSWTETGISGGVRLPLILTRSKYFSELQIGNAVGVTLTSSFGSEVTENGQLILRGPNRQVPYDSTVVYLFNNRTDFGTLISNRFNISYQHMLKQSHRDINPKFGQQVDFEHYSTPYGGDYKGRLWATRALIFFPGLLKHHSLYFRGGYQRSYTSPDMDIYSFRNRVFKPRGYSYPSDSEFSTASVNYAMPLWYPDIAAGPLLNIQRVRSNLFFDYGQGEGIEYFHDPVRQVVYYGESEAKYISAGVEMIFDVNFFRLAPQFQIGFRTTYRRANAYNATSGVVFEVLFGNIAF